MRTASTTSLTIGTFDGVHVGHQALLKRAAELSRGGQAGEVVALCFDPHPSMTLRPADVPARIMSFERKRELLLASGATRVGRLEPQPALLAMSAQDFFAWLCEAFTPGAIVEGPDFRFGKGRVGDCDLLAKLCNERGMVCSIVEPVERTLHDQAIVRASSSLVRWLTRHGRVADAGIVLGRPAEVTGMVVRGDRLGRAIGVPTCNIDTPCLMPGDGVYAGVATLPTGKQMLAAINISSRPTVAAITGTLERRLEAHLLDAGVAESGAWGASSSWKPLEGVPEYGWEIRLEFHAFLRESVKLAGLAALREQIGRDVARVPGAVARSAELAVGGAA